MKKIRAEESVVLPNRRSVLRVDLASGGTFAQVWFLAWGCGWDREGACTMCNYVHGPAVSEDAMVESVRVALHAIEQPVDELLVSPSGSMLDPHEVPPSARAKIFSLMAEYDVRTICVETRAETITNEALAELASAFAGKDVAVEMGLESSSEWVLRYCVNKLGYPDTFRRAAELLASRGIGVYGNVCLGSAFLNAAEAIEDARESVRWALMNGANVAVLFPLHVKSHTLLAFLRERGLYRSPSLWSLIEVLAGLDPRDLPRVTISWYRNDYGPDTKVLDSPTTCPLCRPRVLNLLDRYRANPCSSTLADLTSEECECKNLWRQEVSERDGIPLPERVHSAYELLAHHFGLSEWWRESGGAIRSAIFG